MVTAFGLIDENYDNIPQNENGIRKLVSGKCIKRWSTVGSSACIFGVLLTLTPDYLSMKVGSKLFLVEGTWSAFLITKI